MLNIYMPGTMHTELSITAEEADEAERSLYGDEGQLADFSNRPLAEVRHNGRIASVREHEFFHHRHMCTTTYGLLAFVVYHLGLCHRRWAVDAMPKATGESMKLDMAGLTPEDLSDPCIFHLAGTQFVEGVLDGLDELVRGKIELGVRLNRPHLDGIAVPAAEPTRQQLDAMRDAPTTADIIELNAVWKQGCWLALGWAHSYVPRGRTRDFLYLEKDWLGWLWRTNPGYLAVANYVAQACGVTLRHRLLGVIGHLCLNPPLFSEGAFGWEEMCPRLRLAKVMDVCPDLPELCGKDCLELISQEEMADTVAQIERRLGWRALSSNIEDAVRFLDDRVFGLAPHGEPPASDDALEWEQFGRSRLVGAYAWQFANGFLNELGHPGFVLFPWLHPDSAMVGGILRPIATQYCDRLRLNMSRLEDGVRTNAWVSDPLTALIVLQDTAENIWLYETINNSEIPVGRKLHSRKYYEGIPDALTEHFAHAPGDRDIASTLLRNWPPFERFISARIQRDYDDFVSPSE